MIVCQAVSGIENLLVTIEALAAQPEPGGNLSTFCAAMQEQRHQWKTGVQVSSKYIYLVFNIRNKL